MIHGYRTMFPVPLGEAATWDPARCEKDESVSADEAAADGIKWTFNPMVDISRDPRWGRVVEGAGEDPFLGSAIAAAKVQGYQGNNFAAPNKVAATIKHFGGYGAPVAGREYNTVDMSTQQLFNDYLPPYKAAVDAGAATVMSSFNSLNGVPNTANPYLLTQILRDEWGFGGTTLSDYQAVQELEDFGYASDGADAARLALTAGENIEMAVSMTVDQPGLQHLRDLRPAAAARGQDHDGAAERRRAPRADAQVPGRDVHQPGSGQRQRYNTEELTHGAPGRRAADRRRVDGAAEQQQPRAAAEPERAKIAVVGPLADDAVDQLGPDVPIGYGESPADTGPGDADKIVTVRQGIKNAVGAEQRRLRATGAPTSPSPTRATRRLVSARRLRRRRPRT